MLLIYHCYSLDDCDYFAPQLFAVFHHQQTRHHFAPAAAVAVVVPPSWHYYSSTHYYYLSYVFRNDLQYGPAVALVVQDSRYFFLIRHSFSMIQIDD